MAPIAVEETTVVEAPVVSKKILTSNGSAAAPGKPTIARYDARDPATTTELLVSVLERDGGVIVENIISQELATRIKAELKPYFDTDRVDPSGFFPHTTQRATGLLGRSDGCVELATNPTYSGWDWAQIEPEARRYWDERNPSTWDRFKDSIHDAWLDITGQR